MSLLFADVLYIALLLLLLFCFNNSHKAQSTPEANQKQPFWLFLLQTY